MSQSNAFYLVRTTSAGSTFGRVLPVLLVDRTGPLNMYIPGTLISTDLALVWFDIKITGGLVIFCLLYGLFQGFT
jgi:hypothetical protein